MKPSQYQQLIGVSLVIVGLIMVSPVFGFYIVKSTGCDVYVYDAESSLPIKGAQITLIGFYDPSFNNAYTSLGLYASTTETNGFCSFGTSLSGVKYVVGASADGYEAGQQQVYLEPGVKGKATFNLVPLKQDVEGTWAVNDQVVLSGAVVKLDPDSAITVTFKETVGGVIGAHVAIKDGATYGMVYSSATGKWSVKLALEKGVYTMDLVAEGAHSKMTTTVSVALARETPFGLTPQSVIGLSSAAVGVFLIVKPRKKLGS